MERRYVVGAERGEPTEDGGRKPAGVWHAVAPETRQVVCGEQGVEIFDDVLWQAVSTAVLCQRCLRSVAGWAVNRD